ncbi:MAG: M13 family peptidase, partial [Bacteroidales bacterium]|nr:M13 family peptidase [Bacteroidales bacterium]
MKLKEILPVVAFAVATGVGAQTAGIRMENMDQSYKPGEDFYGFACGGWMKNNPLSAEYARYGSFDALHELN